MGKRSREKRDRRAAEQATATTQASDHARWDALVTALSGGGEAAAHELATACEHLRMEGRLAEALALAARGERRSPALCAEEALAAYALGDDARAERASRGVPGLEQVMAPLLSAARGEAARANSSAPAAVQAGILVSKIVAHLRAGKTVPTSLRYHRSGLALEPSSEALMVAAQEVELGHPYRIAEHLEALHEHGSPALHEAGAGLLARRFSAGRGRYAGLDLSRRAEPAYLAAQQALALAAGGTTDREVLARELAPRARTLTDPVALLYAAYGQLDDDPHAATRTFERALAAGADLPEGLRGLMLAHEDLDESEQAGKQALRLARHFQGTPGGRELALGAAVSAGKAFAARSDARAREAVTLARAIRDTAGLVSRALDTSLELIELQAGASKAPAETTRRVEALLVEEPKLVELWHLRANLAAVLGQGALPEVLARAFAATGDADFDVPLPTATSAPPVAPKTPGAIATAIGVAWQLGGTPPDGALPPALAAAAGRLDARGRAALDVALVALLTDGERKREVLARVRAAHAQRREYGRTLAAASIYSDEAVIDVLWDGFRPQLGAEATFQLLFEAAAEARSQQAALDLIETQGRHVSPAALAGYRKDVKKIRETADPEGGLGAAHDALHPEFCIYDIGMPDTDALTQMARTLGLPLPPELRGPPSPRAPGPKRSKR